MKSIHFVVAVVLFSVTSSVVVQAQPTLTWHSPWNGSVAGAAVLSPYVVGDTLKSVADVTINNTTLEAFTVTVTATITPQFVGNANPIETYTTSKGIGPGGLFRFSDIEVSKVHIGDVVGTPLLAESQFYDSELLIEFTNPTGVKIGSYTSKGTHTYTKVTPGGGSGGPN